MAYGNWGAWVFKNHEHMEKWEDQTPYREEELTPGYYQAFGRVETELSPQHAVLGDGRLRLCAYKTYPRIYLDQKPIDLEPFYKHRGDESCKAGYCDCFCGIDGELEGFRFKTERLDEGNRLELILREPDGDVWTAVAAYMYGAGWDDEPVDGCELALSDPPKEAL